MNAPHCSLSHVSENNSGSTGAQFPFLSLVLYYVPEDEPAGFPTSSCDSVSVCV